MRMGFRGTPEHVRRKGVRGGKGCPVRWRRWVSRYVVSPIDSSEIFGVGQKVRFQAGPDIHFRFVDEVMSIKRSKVQAAAEFAGKDVFKAGDLRGTFAGIAAAIEELMIGVAAVDLQLEAVNVQLLKAQGKTVGKILIHFYDRDGYCKPEIVIYRPYERERAGKKFGVTRVKLTDTNKLSAMRNTQSIGGPPLDNDKAVRRLLDTAEMLIRWRRKEMKAVDLLKRSVEFAGKRATDVVARSAEDIDTAKREIVTDFSDLGSAVESLVARKARWEKRRQEAS